jgi:hypothetical protein
LPIFLKLSETITSLCFELPVNSNSEPKRDEVTGGCRELHNEELHNLCSSIIRMIKSKSMNWAGHVAQIGEKRNTYRILVGKVEGQRLLGRPRRRRLDNIKMDHREIGWDDVDWIDMAQDRDRWRGPLNTGSIKC